jgi:hypothetical protein
VIAAVIGVVCGTIAGYRPQGGERSMAVPAAAATISAPEPPAPVDAPVREPAPAESPLQTPRTAPLPATRVAPEDPLQLARERAKRVDVIGLIALREEVAARAEQAGEQDAPATKQRLNEIDRYLAEARALRLKLDAAEFRKSAPNPREQQE